MKNSLAALATLTSASQFLCLFCCVIPTAAGIIALLATFGLTGVNSMFLGNIAHAIHPWQNTIMVAAVFMISLSWCLWFYSYKRAKIAENYVETGCGCHSRKSKKPVFLMVATLLLVFNSMAFMFMH